MKIIYYCYYIYFIIQIININCINYCTYENIYSGRWKYKDITKIKKNPYYLCPKTMNKIMNISHLKHQIKLFSCVNKTYIHAKYFTESNCYIRSISSSLHQLSYTKSKLYFVGDSLMGQLYIAFLCNSEMYGYFDKISSTYILETFLRPDIPCDPRCLSDKHFLAEENAKGIHQMCFACHEGIFHELNNSFTKIQQFWPAQVRLDGTHLIIGTGSWYNGYRKLFQPDYYYNETLSILVPVLNDLTINSNVKSIHWLDLPPMRPIPPPYVDLFGWNNFLVYNKYAELKFKNTNITYLDTANATKQRKFHDLNITDEFQHHWCNPGIDMIPTFQIQTYLHFISLNL